MFSQDKNKIGIETGEETQCQASQLSQIYLEQWEKENLKPKIEKKKQMKTVRKPLEDKKCNENKGIRFKKKGKKITQERQDELVQFKKKDEKIEKEREERSVEDLVAENNNLKDNLEHSRRICRELLQKVRYERDRKRFKKEDFQTIQNVLKRYM